MRQAKLLIDGTWQDAVAGKTFDSVNPATGEIIAQVAEGDEQDIDLAVRAARRAYDGPWSAVDPADRGRLLLKLADLVEAHGDELAMLDTQDAGRPLADCKADVGGAAAVIRFAAGLPDKIYGHTIPMPRGYLAYTRREPYGVVGAITPWNYPFLTACVKIAPILAMGNTCVLKPAEQAPLSALEVGQLALEAGMPAGVLNVVTGMGATAGAALAEHRGVDKIGFTGSTQVGRLILEAAARSNLKPVALELGGKSPNILFEDAQIEVALDSAVRSVFYNQGQTCTAATRLLVHKSIAPRVIDGLVARAARIRVGDPLEPGIHLGAVVSARQFERVTGYIARGVQEGAQLCFGGRRPDNPELAKGYYIMPTVFAQVRPEMAIAREEIFGPVLAVLEFETEDEAVRLANQVDYGLAAAVWTRDAARLHRVAHAVEAGLVWANCVGVGSAALPVSGYKQSGYGSEYGTEAGLEYTRLKTVVMSLTEQDASGWLG